MEAALFQDTPALLAAQLDPKTQKAAEEAFAQQQRSNPRQLASELVSCLGNAQLNPAVRQLAATLSKRFTAPRRALGALGEWNSQAVDGFRSALWQALASGPEPPVARALCVAVAEEASDANQPWPAASSNCVAGLGAAPGTPQATVALTLCAVGDRRPLYSRRWRGGSPTHHTTRDNANAGPRRRRRRQGRLMWRRQHLRGDYTITTTSGFGRRDRCIGRQGRVYVSDPMFFGRQEAGPRAFISQGRVTSHASLPDQGRK